MQMLVAGKRQSSRAGPLFLFFLSTVMHSSDSKSGWKYETNQDGHWWVIFAVSAAESCLYISNNEKHLKYSYHNDHLSSCTTF